jgi:hypothetical protein
VVCGRHGRTAGGDDRTRHHAGRRTVVRVALARSEAFLHRRDPRTARIDPRVAPLPRVDLLCEAADRLTVHEGRCRHRGHAARHTIVNVRVVNVGHIRHVMVVVVDAVVVTRAPVIVTAPVRMPPLARA